MITFNEMGEKIIELKLTPVKELKDAGDFKIYACKSESNLIELNKYGNFVIHGEIQKLHTDVEYDAVLKEVVHKNYGKGYKVINIKQQMPLTIEEKQNFLRMILTDHQANLLIEAMPNEDIIEKIKNNTLNYTKIKGIGKTTYEKIRKTVLENINIQEALSELGQYGVSYRIVKKLLARYNNSSEMLLQKINENPYILCTEVSGLGFKKVDGYAVKMGVDANSPFRINAAIIHILQQEESNGHCWIYIDDIIRKVFDLTGINKDLLKEHIEKNKNNNKELYVDELRIGLRKHYIQELKIGEKLLELLSVKDNFDVPDIDNRIAEIEKSMGFVFNNDQRNAIYQAVRNNVIIICGKAGTGKTSVLRGIMHVLKDFSYSTCALSGKASQRIIESTGLNSSTIHRLLGYVPKMGFTYNKDNPLPDRIIVVDEFSMVDVSLFYRLIQAIKLGTKLIILGDTEQLPAIGAGLLLRDMIESGKIPVVELTEVHRQALKSGILLAANQVRDGKQITKRDEKGSKVVGELKDLYIVLKESNEDIFDYVKDLCIKARNRLNLNEFQVIAPIKKGMLGTKSLNQMLQDIFNPSESDESIKRNGYEYRVKDKIIKSGNDYTNAVFNGTIGYIEEIDTVDYTIKSKFNGKEDITEYSGEELGSIDIAYALTTHKCITEDTYIYSDKGILQLKDLNNGALEGEYKKLNSDIQIFNGETLETPSRFLNAGKRRTKIISTRRGYEIEATEDHRFNVLGPDGYIIVKETSEIKENDYVLIHKNINTFGTLEFIPEKYLNEDKLDIRSIRYNKPKVINKDFSLFLGLLVSDGTVFKNKKGIRYTKKVKELTKKFQELSYKLFGYKNDYYLKKTGDYAFDIHSTDIANFISKFDGVNSKNKYVPEIIMQTTEENQCSFLQGLFEDGTVNIKKTIKKSMTEPEYKFDHIELTLKGKKIVKQVQMMLLNMGIICTMKKRPRYKDHHSLYIYRDYAELFMNKIGFITPMKKEMLKKCVIRDGEISTNNISIPHIHNIIRKIIMNYGLKNKITYGMKNALSVKSITNNMLNRFIKLFENEKIKNNDVDYLKYISQNIYFDKVVNIENSINNTYCIEMPESHKFIQNGFYGFNCQGDQFENIVFVFDYSSYKLLTRQMIYTALTRASKKCILVCDNRALRYAISNNLSTERNTWLKDVLLGNLDIEQEKELDTTLIETEDWIRDDIEWSD